VRPVAMIRGVSGRTEGRGDYLVALRRASFTGPSSPTKINPVRDESRTGFEVSCRLRNRRATGATRGGGWSGREAKRSAAEDLPCDISEWDR
jgi:hypothetical protein